MTLTYQLAEGPEVICAQMLQGCAKQALEKLEKHTPEEDPSEWAEVCLLRGRVGSQGLVFSLKGEEPQPTLVFIQADGGPVTATCPTSLLFPF